MKVRAFFWRPPPPAFFFFFGGMTKRGVHKGVHPRDKTRVFKSDGRRPRLGKNNNSFMGIGENKPWFLSQLWTNHNVFSVDYVAVNDWINTRSVATMFMRRTVNRHL
jgi:hypothetical protein